MERELRRRAARHAVAATLALILPSCGDFNIFQDPCGGPCPTPAPQECGGLSRVNWRIGPFPTSSENELRLAVGESRSVFLDPFVEAHCAGSIPSVSWSTDDPSVASVTAREPAYRGSWVTGVRPGPGAVHARILFSDGSVQEATPRAIIVAPLALSGAVVAEGVILMDAPIPGSRFIPFDLPRDASRVDVSVDWTSVRNIADVFLWRGSCSGPANCGGLEFLPLPSVTGVKPVRKSIANLSAGAYSLRIDNLGPGAENIQYEVRLTPR